MEGTVKKFVEDKKYGFITADGKDFFFHITGCIEGYEPKEGDNVSFSIGTNERTGKTQAENVQAA